MRVYVWTSNIGNIDLFLIFFLNGQFIFIFFLFVLHGLLICFFDKGGGEGNLFNNFFIFLKLYMPFLIFMLL